MSFIEIKEMAEGRERERERDGGRERERGRDLLATSEEQQKESKNGQSLSPKETFCTCVQTS